MKRKIKLLVVDDHELVRTGIATVLGLEKDIRIVGTARTGAEALEEAGAKRPDVVVMDLAMPEMDGATATERLRGICPEAKILILTSFGTGEALRRALDAGAAGALLKSESNAQIAKSIREIVAGRRVMSDEISDALEPVAGPNLTPRQIEVLRGIARGQSNKQISAQIGISLGGIKKHIGHIFEKLGVTSRSEATVAAVRNRLVKY